MTQPRMCLAGTTYLVTRTIHNRQLLLTPSPVVNAIVMYCAARAAVTQNVELHWISVQANHIHLGLTDPGTNLSKFMQVMDRLIACCLIEHYRDTHPSPGGHGGAPPRSAPRSRRTRGRGHFNLGSATPLQPGFAATQPGFGHSPSVPSSAACRGGSSPTRR